MQSGDCAALKHWIQEVIDKDHGLTINQIAHTCKNRFGLPEKMIPALRRVVRIKKENRRVRDWKRRSVATGGTRPPRKKTTAFTRLLTDGTYPVHPSLPERVPGPDDILLQGNKRAAHLAVLSPFLVGNKAAVLVIMVLEDLARRRASLLSVLILFTFGSVTTCGGMTTQSIPSSVS